jgi:hypothetical protein
MMTAHQIDAGGPAMKVRRPLTVVLLNVVTFCIYGIVWYYKINRELLDYGKAHEDDDLSASKPIRSVLAVTLGSLLIVPPLVSYVGVVRRTQRAERIATQAPRSRPEVLALLVASWVLGLAGAAPVASTLLLVLAGVSVLAWLAAVALLQARLNAVWQTISPAPAPFTGMARPEAVTGAIAQ